MFRFYPALMAENRAFKRLWWAHAATSVGDTMVEVALVFAALELGASPPGIGLTLGAVSLAPIAFLFIGGVVGDRYARNRVVTATHVFRALVQGLVAAVLLTGIGGLASLILLVFLYGVAEAFYSPASTAILPSIVDPLDLQTANAALSVVRRTIGVVGPAVGGLLVASAGPAWVFVIDAASFVVAAILYRSIGPKYESAQVTIVEKRIVAEFRAGWVEFSSRRWLWVSVVVFSASGLAFVPLFTLGPILSSSFEFGAASWGICVGVGSIGSVVGSLAAGLVKIKRPLFTATVLVLFLSLPLFALAGSTSLFVLAIALAAAWAAAAMANTLFASVLQFAIPQDKLARVSSFSEWGSLVLTPMTYAVVGPAAALLGSQTLLAASGISLIAATALGLLIAPDIRHVGGATAEV